ncbi:ABC transporter substrate-binding protein [Micromonospora haikouensis]|uniref:ABC transporter substrate-binding protein n=1 Tax=Micromonospora haikouensis TaxID=686309 RepID=UPI00343C6CB8
MRLTKAGVVAGVLGVSLLLGTAACGDDAAESAGSGGPAKVTVNSLEILSLAPMMVADAKGFFGKHDVEVEFSNADIYSRLAVQGQGKLDVNIPGTGGALFNAVNQGLRVRVVADRQQYRCASDNMLLARTAAYDGGLKGVADLKGKKVAILAKGSSTEYWLDRALGQVGLKQSDLGQVVTLSYPDTANALKSGAVDAGFLVEPLAYQLISDGQARRVLAMNEVAPNQEQGLITMSQDFIDKRPEVAARWMAGWLEGVRYYQDPANRDEVVKIVSERTKVPAETIGKLYGTDQWPYMDPNGRVDTATVVAEDGKWLLDNKIIEKLPEVSGWHDGSVVDAALKIVGEVPVNRDCSSVKKLES